MLHATRLECAKSAIHNTHLNILYYACRASDISRGCRPAKFWYLREIPQNKKKREIPRNPPEIFPNTLGQNIFNTYLGY